MHGNVVRRWVREYTADPQQAFPGQGQMKPEQAEIERLRREVVQAQGGAGHLKKSRGLLREGVDVKFGFMAKHRGIWPVAWLCEALGVSRSRVLCVADAAAEAGARVDDEVLVVRIRRKFPSTVIGPTVRVASGVTCWPRASVWACIGSSD